MGWSDDSESGTARSIENKGVAFRSCAKKHSEIAERREMGRLGAESPVSTVDERAPSPGMNHYLMRVKCDACGSTQHSQRGTDVV
jgi:hypothetical protein